jgi:hypothetical protein
MDILAEIDQTGIGSAKGLELAIASSKRNTLKLRNYADILYVRIFEDVFPHRNNHLENLKKAIEDPNAPMRVRIWDYSVTYRVDGNSSQAEDMPSFSERGHHTVLFDNGKPISVDTIFHNTDLAWRLAFTYGSKYRVSLVREDLKATNGEYDSYRIGVYLHYHPNGLLPYAEEQMIRAYKGVCDRQLYVGDCTEMTGR